MTDKNKALVRLWFPRFMREQPSQDNASGLILLGATLAALAWRNSPWGASYEPVWGFSVSLGWAGHVFSEPLRVWVNDGLMAIFFFVIGLEIKHEVLTGHLSSPRRAALPVAAAIGGMIVPAILFALFNPSAPGSSGWGIPMATDIAFALGALSLAGSRVPLGLKIFLTALAVVDDLGAVLVIALFYASDLEPSHVAIATAYLAALLAANRLGVRHPLVYALVGVIGVWHCFFLSGIHPTIAGVLFALAVPARVRVRPSRQARTAPRGRKTYEQAEAPLRRVERAIRPWVIFVILPIFALANAGVPLGRDLPSILSHPVALGVLVGLVLGKQIGISLSAWLAVRLGVARLPVGVGWAHIYGVAWLGGIGFTMSIFVASLAFQNTELLYLAKTAILTSSVVAGAVGWAFLRRFGGELP